MNTKHGFLTADIEGCKNWRVVNLVEYTLDHGYTHLWIMPETVYETTVESEENFAEFNRLVSGADNYKIDYHVPTVNNPHKYLSSVTARRLQPPSEPVNIIWLSQSGWGLPADVPALQRTFSAVESALGVSMNGSAGTVGLAYLRAVDAKNYYKYFALPKDIEWPFIKSVSVSSISSFPPVTGEALDKEFVWCYDRHSSQPYAASQVRTGVGQPIARQGGVFDHLIPGFWACDIEGLDQLWQGLPLLPANREWLPTPLVKMCEQMGCKITVHECYIWPEKKDRAPVFHKWAHGLWALREQYAPGTPEREAIKSIMNKTIGLLRRKKGEGYRDYRPDWYSLILAEERAVVWWKARQVAEKTGIQPVGGYHDALYYCADEPIQELITRLDKNGVLHSTQHSLGGYKVDWKLPICEEVRAILADEKCNPVDRIGYLKKWGRENGHI